IFHKHRMYNLGVALAEGEICVICDSDAMFTPTFIESIIGAFEQQPRSVVHLDEIRSASREFYPFNFPTFDEFLASHCPNWSGRSSKGLSKSNDMLHEANYGACMAARRDDLIAIGGSDEHLDYLGYICGPYELTFRLVNAGCTERWLGHEYLYHTWHPGESGFNIDFQGPSDGRGMSMRALEARDSGRVQPAQENGAIRALRENPRLVRRAALAHLESPEDEQWRCTARMAASDRAPAMIEAGFLGKFDVYFHRHAWYALAPGGQPFDPIKAASGEYLRGHSRDELERAIRRDRRLKNPVRKLLAALYWSSRKLAKRFLSSLGLRVGKPPDPDWHLPHIVGENFRNYDLVYFQGRFFGIEQSHGSFKPSLVNSDSPGPYVAGRSLPELKQKIIAHDDRAPKAPAKHGEIASGGARRTLRKAHALAEGPRIHSPLSKEGRGGRVESCTDN
ncbi:MAG TPA: glycosyltransferase, partial [Planctomycetaceae bacterium]|nr:glycosyltransferase [Planctomycetaceae bacterium]